MKRPARRSVPDRRRVGRSVPADGFVPLDPASRLQPPRDRRRHGPPARQRPLGSRRGRPLREIVRSGTSSPSPELAHGVHVELSGLAPDRPYWYRFRGRRPPERRRPHPHRARPGAPPPAVRFGVASCNSFQDGLLHRVRPHGPRGVRPRVPPGRLHLRGRRLRQAGPEPARAGMHHAGPLPAGATRSTRPTRPSRRSTPPRRGSSRPTTTRSTTTGPARSPRRRTSRRGLPQRRAAPTRRCTRTCRCGSPRSPGARHAALPPPPWGRLADFFVLDTRQYRTDQPAATATSRPRPSRWTRTAP
jgi:hypothetical protein